MFKIKKEVLLISVTIILLVLSIGLFALKEKQRYLKNKTALELDNLRVSLSRVQDKHKDNEKTQTKLKEKLDEFARESAALEIQIAQIEKVYNESQSQLSAVKRETVSSRKKKRTLQKEKKQLTKQITAAKSGIKELNERLDTLKETTSALDKHLKRKMRLSGVRKRREPEQEAIKEDVQFKQTASQYQPQQEHYDVVTEASPKRYSSQETISLEGEILVVNREFNFVVISLGKEDNLKEGASLKVYDDDKLLGEVLVETVRNNISAASGGKNLDAYKMRAGNKVYLLK